MLATCKLLFKRPAYSLMDYKKLSTVFTMFRFAVQHSMHHFDSSDVVIAIPPRYQKLYEYLCFEQISEMRYYEKYNTPALPLRLKLKEALHPSFSKELGRAYLVNFFFKSNIPIQILSRTSRFSPEDIELLFVQKSDLLSRLSAEETDLLKEVSPETARVVMELQQKQKDQNKSRNLFETNRSPLFRIERPQCQG